MKVAIKFKKLMTNVISHSIRYTSRVLTLYISKLGRVRHGPLKMSMPRQPFGTQNGFKKTVYSNRLVDMPPMPFIDSMAKN